MTPLTAFLLGVLCAWSPVFVVLGLMLWRQAEGAR